MLKNLKKWLDPPLFPDNEEKSNRARLVNSLGLYFVLALLIAAFIYVPFFVKYKIVSWAAIVALFAIFLISRIFLYRGRLTFASLFLLASGWMICVVFAALGGGISSPLIFVLAAITIAVGLLFHSYIETIFLVLSILAVLGLAALQQAGLTLPRPFGYSPLSIWFFFSISLLFTSWTMKLTVRELEKALGQARRQNEARELAEAISRISESKYRTLHESLRDGFVYADMAGRIVEFNEPYRQMLGYDSQELLTLTYPDLTPERWQASENAIIQDQVLFQGYSDVYEKEYRRKDGKVFPVEFRTFLIRDDSGKHLGMWAIVRDITERKRVEKAERDQRALAEAFSNSAAALNSSLDLNIVLGLVLDNVGRVVPHDAVNLMLLDKDGDTLTVACSRGYAERGCKDILSTRLSLSTLPNLVQAARTMQPLIIRNTLANSGWLDFSFTHWVASCLTAPILIHQRIVGFLNLDSAKVGFFSSTDAERLQAFANQVAAAVENAQLYKEVQKLAITDILTGLYNRTFFETELQRIELGRSFPVSIVVADLDNMKITNDTLGHTGGDELLKRTALVLKDAFRTSDIIARIGGDEFAILLPETDTAIVEEKLLRVQAKSIEFNAAHPDLPVRLSLGAATALKGGLPDAFILADQRMYANKSARKLQVNQISHL